MELLHLRARWYSPEAGTFLSKDPWEGDYLRSQTINGWSYVGGNPVNWIDPSGMIPVQPRTPCKEDNICIKLFGKGPVVYRRPNYDLILFPEGYPNTPRLLDNEGYAFWYGLQGVLLDVTEIGAIVSVQEPTSDLINVVDLATALAVSTSLSESYIGKPHNDLPEMTVVGQEVLVGGIDTVVGTGGKWAFRAAGLAVTIFGQPEAGLTLAGIAQGIDLTTTTIQGVYDAGRLFGYVPTVAAFGVYREGTQRRVAIMFYCSF